MNASTRSRHFFGGESTASQSFDPAKELGVQDPVGFWDPLGLSADKDEATFKRRRAVEIKHGRIAASLNFCAPVAVLRHRLCRVCLCRNAFRVWLVERNWYPLL